MTTEIPIEAQGASRYDMYTNIHKTLRNMMYHAQVDLGAADPADDVQVQAALSRVRELLTVCRAHLEHENEFVHTAMERRQPGSSARIAEEHVSHEKAIEKLENEVREVERARGAARAPALLALYRKLGLFIADNLEHMHYEETVHNAVLAAAYSDEELAAIEADILAHVAPQSMGMILRWMLPSIQHGQRMAMLEGMRVTAPPQAFQGALAVAREHLSKADWAKLAQGLDIPVQAAA
ncbi:MAG: hemerythrin domain-containing protein [Arenicellales bacterium]|jgi:hypothetical protein